jgi:3-hydroxyisobutyrate dehydrogenase-like beta-hydroxyacid dehydrogenase
MPRCPPGSRQSFTPPPRRLRHQRTSVRRPAGAENRVLTVMCGGNAAPFEPTEKVISADVRLENRYETMAAGKCDFGFAVDWMRKDLGICLAEAWRNCAHLPRTVLVSSNRNRLLPISTHLCHAEVG